MGWTGPSFTRVAFQPLPERISLGDKVWMIGSCFTEHIGFLLSRYKYAVSQNPFGILYNPASIATCIESVVQQRLYTTEELVFQDGLYHSMDHHGSFSGVDADQVIDHINQTIVKSHQALRSANYVMISPGTAIVYQVRSTGSIAGNCHKIPQADFEKLRMTPDDCIAAFEKIISLISTINSKARMIWTVSPVRHWKDGLIENQRSKATLILGIDAVIQQNPHHHYFPAYEIMMDQLRSYRYYAEDLVHPSAEAINIIWETFRESYLNPTDNAYHLLVEKIIRACEHRFLHSNVAAIHQFATAGLRMVEQAAALHPTGDWTRETDYFTQLISDHQPDSIKPTL